MSESRDEEGRRGRCGEGHGERRGQAGSASVLPVRAWELSGRTLVLLVERSVAVGLLLLGIAAHAGCCAHERVSTVRRGLAAQWSHALVCSESALSESRVSRRAALSPSPLVRRAPTRLDDEDFQIPALSGLCCTLESCHAQALTQLTRPSRRKETRGGRAASPRASLLSSFARVNLDDGTHSDAATPPTPSPAA